MPGCEVYDDARCQNVLIKNNTFTELYRAIGTHSAVVGKYMSNITISDNFSPISKEKQSECIITKIAILYIIPL